MNEWQSILKNSKSLAVVGLSGSPSRTSFGVSLYMNRAGYDLIPVNPFLKEPIWGLTPVSSLSKLTSPVDIINVFRKTEDLPDLVEEICNLTWRPKLCWFQLNMTLSLSDRHRLESQSIEVVTDRCIMVEHRFL